jgi:hypothetical protein
MKKRLEFKCWNCEKTYSLLREIGEGNPILWVACPFCGKEGIVDLNPFREKADLIHKTGSPQTTATDEIVYDLPDILPTQPKS